MRVVPYRDPYCYWYIPKDAMKGGRETVCILTQAVSQKKVTKVKVPVPKVLCIFDTGSVSSHAILRH